jgi:hypothetical protein
MLFRTNPLEYFFQFYSGEELAVLHPDIFFAVSLTCSHQTHHFLLYFQVNSPTKDYPDMLQ